MILLDKAVYAVNFSVNSDRAAVIQTAQHQYPTTPTVRRRIVFFIERLIYKPVRISALALWKCHQGLE